MQEIHLKRFMALFRGNNRSFGRFMPDKPKGKQAITEKRAFTTEDFSDHLAGRVGVGIVPIRDDGTCFFAAIDIDNHGQSEDLDIAAIGRKVKALRLPLIPCRSRSGGVHLYLFGSEPLKANTVKTLMTKWMFDLGIEGSDCVFPKQHRLAISEDGERALGNWINLPYFGGEDTNRHAFLDGKVVPFDLFLTEAENRALTQAELDSMYASEHSEAPPCVQTLISRGLGAGERNTGAYQIAVYLRKKDPDSARDQSHDLLNRICSDPLPFREADRTIKSALRKDYGYKCGDEPFKSLCDRAACRKRKFGISELEDERMSAMDNMPKFNEIIKYLNTDPVKYEIKVNGKSIFVVTAELFDYNIIRNRVFDITNTVMPPLKRGDWEKIISELATQMRIEEAPSETSPTGIIRVRLEEFIRKADLTSQGDDTRERERLLRGLPVVQIMRDQRVIMFRAVDFSNYLRMTKTDEVKNKDLWFKANRELGVEHDRIRIGKRFVNIWYLAVPDEDEIHVPDMSPEY